MRIVLSRTNDEILDQKQSSQNETSIGLIGPQNWEWYMILKKRAIKRSFTLTFRAWMPRSFKMEIITQVIRAIIAILLLKA